MTLDDLAGPFWVEQIREALRRILGFDKPRIVTDHAEADAECCEHAVRVLLFGRKMSCGVLRYEGSKQAVTLPHDEMRGVGGIDHIHCVNVAGVFLADALK